MIPRQLTNAAAMLTSKYDFSASLKSSAGRIWREHEGPTRGEELQLSAQQVRFVFANLDRRLRV